jgi:restriction system protein
MSIPDYQTIMLPLLQFLSDGKVYNTRELIEGLAFKFTLTNDERKELLPSGQQPIFDNRVGWARTYLKKAGLVESDKRGTQKISLKGLEVLKKKPNRIDISFLEQFPEFIEFRTLRNASGEEEALLEHHGNKTPEELLEANFTSIQSDLAHDLLDKIKDCTPEFFEKIVVDLIVGMGYGGSRLDAGKAVGKSGDG